MSHPELLEKSSHVFIRHGLSHFNYMALVASTEFGEKSDEFRKV
jgi:hypothetical protein